MKEKKFKMMNKYKNTRQKKMQKKYKITINKIKMVLSCKNKKKSIKLMWFNK